MRSAAIRCKCFRNRLSPVVAGVVFLLASASIVLGARIEFLSGSKVEGEIVARDEQSVTIKTTIGGREFTRKYPLDRLFAGLPRQVALHGVLHGSLVAEHAFDVLQVA